MEYNIEEKERKLDFKQCFLYIIEHLAAIIIVAVLVAGLAGTFGFYRTSKTKLMTNTYQTVVAQNRDAFYPTGGKVTYNTEKLKVERTCIVRGEIYTDFNFKSIEGNSNLDFSAMVSRLQKDAMVRMVSDSSLEKICNDINSRSYDSIDGMEDITVEELRWLINMDYTGANVLQYSITDVSTDRALDIAKLVSDKFIDECKNFEIIDSAKVIEKPFVFSDKTSDFKSFDVKTVIKFAILGGIVAVILMCGLYFLIFIFVDTVRISDDVEYVGLHTLSIIPQKSVRREAQYKRTAYSIALHEDVKSIMLAPVDPKTDVDEIYEKINDEISELGKEVKLLKVSDLISSADAIKASQDVDSAILVATFGKTTIKDIKYAQSEISKTGKKILGVIISNAKH